MKYATHMLDGFDFLYKRTDDVLKSCKEHALFFQKLSGTESVYAKDLLKIAKKFRPSKAVEKELGYVCPTGTVCLRSPLAPLTPLSCVGAHCVCLRPLLASLSCVSGRACAFLAAARALLLRRCAPCACADSTMQLSARCSFAHSV
jgi:Fes/CIP4, and EFC/F-BAR homology domain